MRLGKRNRRRGLIGTVTLQAASRNCPHDVKVGPLGFDGGIDTLGARQRRRINRVAIVVLVRRQTPIYVVAQDGVLF